MTLSSIFGGIFGSAADTVEQTDTTATISAEQLTSARKGTLVDFYDVSHASVDHERTMVNDAWWNNTGRFELREAMDELDMDKVELAESVGITSTYVDALINNTTAKPGDELLSDITEMLWGEGIVQPFENPVFDILVEGATVA